MEYLTDVACNNNRNMRTLAYVFMLSFAAPHLRIIPSYFVAPFLFILNSLQNTLPKWFSKKKLAFITHFTITFILLRVLA